MSFRLLGHRLFQHGRQFVYNHCAKRNIHINILDHKKSRGVSRQLGLAAKEGINNNSTQWALRNNGLIRFGQHARRLFVDNILNRITPIYSADLRNEATKKFLFGDSAPLFALIGVCLASGTGLLNKDDELEGVCWEIREAVSRLHNKSTFGQDGTKAPNELNLDDLIVGAPIAKGCSAVVYAAALKDKSDASPLKVPDYDSDESSAASIGEASPLRNVNRYVHNFGSSLENPHYLNRNVQANEAREPRPARKVLFNSKANIKYQSSSNLSHDDRSERNSNGSSPTMSFNDEKNNDLETYPLALKMMFNYDIQSNAMAILRAMYKETIPAINKYSNADADGWEKQLRDQTVQLPPHPNIVLMVGVFCAQVPNLMQSNSLYPMALPQRLNPQGYGRNMSLFLLMKRYEYSLCEYLLSTDISMRTRLLLFTQLLEGAAHLYRHGIAHRDLKSDNILIDLNGNDKHPVLVLSDFGCCLADKNNGLMMPYTSMDTDKGGNAALMAPEIMTKTPGTFSILDYSKSDLWACGTIAYEIFGSINPFYGKINMNESLESAIQPSLKSATYQDDELPNLSENVPLLVRKLISNILHRNPNQRLAPDIAANVMQLFLWAPSSWLKSTTINSPEILQWLLSLTTKVLYEARLGAPRSFPEKNDTFGLRNIETNRTHTEYLLLSSFLIRSQLQQIRSALDWIHQSIEVN